MLRRAQAHQAARGNVVAVVTKSECPACTCSSAVAPNAAPSWAQEDESSLAPASQAVAAANASHRSHSLSAEATHKMDVAIVSTALELL